MSITTIPLPEPPKDLHVLSDKERKIGDGPVFVLAEIQNFLKEAGHECLELNVTVAQRMRNEMGWTVKDLCNFIMQLERRHFLCSEWCYASGGSNIAHAADVYKMGFNRVHNVEWQHMDPKQYVKFSFASRDGVLMIFSAHNDDY